MSFEKIQQPSAESEPEIETGAEETIETFLENKEKKETAEVSVSIDRGVLEQLKAEVEHDTDRELLETFLRLPEKLDFQPGMTLIVGENGSGKSTLAKALFLAVEIKEKEETVKKNAARDLRMDFRPEKARDDFRNAQEIAADMILNPGGDMGRTFFNASSGLAVEISKAINVQRLTSQENLNYVDVGEIVGGGQRGGEERFMHNILPSAMESAKAFQEGRQAQSKRTHEEAAQDMAESSREAGSQRQMVDKVIPRRLRPTEGFDDDNEPEVFFIDEPESGMSPRRQKEIEHYIKELTDGPYAGDPRSITIIPTNSYVLYYSRTPRIDLDNPERGIFVPSEDEQEK